MLILKNKNFPIDTRSIEEQKSHCLVYIYLVIRKVN